MLASNECFVRMFFNDCRESYKMEGVMFGDLFVGRYDRLVFG